VLGGGFIFLVKPEMPAREPILIFQFPFSIFRLLTTSSRTPHYFSSHQILICKKGVITMSLAIFLAICIVGVDFLIYVLFQWTFGDKRRAIARKLAAHREAAQIQTPAPPRPFLVQAGPQTRARLQKVRARLSTHSHQKLA
jgi:hypothetical protein